MTALIKVPFAQSGDKSEVPLTDAGGGVNWTQGYPIAYSKDPATDPAAKRIERELFNGLMNRVTTAVNEIQTHGVAPYITPTDNGGTPFAYGLGVLVFYNGGLYQSLINTNTDLPTVAASWQPIVNAGQINGRLLNHQVITTSQLWTPNALTKFAIVDMVGASGGSGGVAATGSNTTVITSPSSQGAYACFLYNNPVAQNITVGTPGTAGTSGGGNGGQGGNTLFGSLATCLGGQGSYSAIPSSGLIQPAPGSAVAAPTISGSLTLLSSIFGRQVQNALQISVGVATNFGASPQGPMPGTRFGASTDGVYRAVNSPAFAGNVGFTGACRIWEYS